MKKRVSPRPTGEYAVGTFTYTVYNDRPEVLKEHENEMRSVAADMASRSEEQSASTSNALDDCRQMIEIAEQFNREGTEVENSGKELKELSLKLDDTVEKFRV